jgi:type VI secretion system protein ImpH
MIPGPELREILEQEPYLFHFFQAVRLLQKMRPDHSPVGRFEEPRTEAVRFGVAPSLAFPASEIQALEWTSSEPAQMTVNFMGITGPLGVTPYPYTELVSERTRAKDFALRDFLDIFNHRMISLFYRAWLKAQFTIAYEADRREPFTERLAALVGLGETGLRERQDVRDESLMFYCGQLSRSPRSAVVLQSVIEDYFGVKVQVEQFTGTWRRVGRTDLTALEGDEHPAAALGSGALAGDEIWDPNNRVRIVLGPLSAAQYDDFLPTGSAYGPLRALTRYFSSELEFEVQLVMDKAAVTGCVLDVETAESPRLSWTCWIKSREGFNRDPGDTIILL